MKPSVRLRVVLACTMSIGLGSSGCASVVRAGLDTLVDDDRAASAPGTAYPGVAPSAPRVPSAAPEPAGGATRSVYEVAPTHDWQTASLGQPYTPAQFIFGHFAPRQVACQAVPVGLAQVYSGPTGPSASPLVQFGILEMGLAGPDGVAEDLLASSQRALASRAFRSGARLAGNGPMCGNRLFFYLRIGRTPAGVNVAR